METHVVAVSGGKDSTALAIRLAELEPRDYVYLITPTGNELPEMFAHWERLERLLGKPMHRLHLFEGDGLRQLIEFYSALPNHRQRWCTRQLKIELAMHYLSTHRPCVQYVGLRADEEERKGIYGDIPGVQQRFPLREWGWTEKEVHEYLAARGVCIPSRTDCAWCYGQRLIEWKRLWQQFPEKYQEAVDLETRYGRTFRSDKRDTWPAALAGLRDEFASGRKVRGEDSGKEVCRVCRM